MKLIHDQPENQGVANALKRAKQISDLRWVPVRQFPLTSAYAPKMWSAARRPRIGVPYSGVRIHEKFVGFNVSLETFMTAMQNPNSVLYTKPQQNMGAGMAAYYGSVCAVFVSYALDMPYRVPTAEWPDEPYVERVDDSDLDNLRLCDILVCRNVHVALITDIARDENGHVQWITVSEEARPLCRVEAYTAPEFRRAWLDDPEEPYFVIRLKDFSHVTYTPSPYVPLEGDPELPLPEVNTAFLPDFGDKFNCEAGEKVSFTVFESGWDEIVATDPEGKTIRLPVENGTAAFTPMTPGRYTAVCRSGGRESKPVSWYVTDMILLQEKTVYAAGEPIRVTLSNPAGEPAFAYNISTEMYRSVKNGFFDRPTAHGELELPGRAPGSYRAFVVARNEYGAYRSTRINFTVR